MVEFWKPALGIAGLGCIVSFVIWSLYKEWLKLPIWQSLTKKQQYNLFVLFLIFTFLFALSGLVTYIFITKIKHPAETKQNNQDKHEPVEDKLNKIFIKANSEYIKSLFGTPIINRDIQTKKLKEEIYSYPDFFLQVIYNESDQVVLYSVTSKNKNFKPISPIIEGKLGEHTFSEYGNEGHIFYSYDTSKHCSYAEEYYFGNLGNYHHYYLVDSASGVDFDENDDIPCLFDEDKKSISEFREKNIPNTYAIGEIKKNDLELPWDFEIGIPYIIARDIPY